MAKGIKPAGYDGSDATRNVIKSHNTMLVSFPTELKLRAGLARGVQVECDYDSNDPHRLIVNVVNPHDYSEELEAFLAKATEKATAATAKADRAEKKKAAAEELANLSPSEQEIRADAVKYGIDASEKYYPEGWRKGDAYGEAHPMYEAPAEEAPAADA